LNDVAWENKKPSRAAFSHEIAEEIRLVDRRDATSSGRFDFSDGNSLCGSTQCRSTEYVVGGEVETKFFRA